MVCGFLAASSYYDCLLSCVVFGGISGTQISLRINKLFLALAFLLLPPLHLLHLLLCCFPGSRGRRVRCSEAKEAEAVDREDALHHQSKRRKPMRRKRKIGSFLAQPRRGRLLESLLVAWQAQVAITQLHVVSRVCIFITNKANET